MKFCKNVLRNNSFTTFLLIFSLLCATGFSQMVGELPTSSTALPTTMGAVTDSTKPAAAAADSLPMRVIKKDLNAREQILIGASVMAFIVVVMAFMNNFNPN